MRGDEIAASLGGRRCGQGWIATCPAHDDRVPSLSIRDAEDGNVLIHCHAGCNQRDVIDALRARGAWKSTGQGVGRLMRNAKRRPPTEPDADALKRTESALAVWRASRSGEKTPVETYLYSRALTMPVPSSIRFHAGLKHPSGGVWPSMVALVTHGGAGNPIGIHRTFLARDGNGRRRSSRRR